VLMMRYVAWAGLLTIAQLASATNAVDSFSGFLSSEKQDPMLDNPFAATLYGSSKCPCVGIDNLPGFFAALFGTHHFEPYVGRLRLAQDIEGDLQSLMRDIVAVDETSESGPQLDSLKVSRAHKKMKALERERQVKCAVKLVERLEPVVNAPPDQKEQALMKWQAGIEEEVDKLKKAPCGVEMLYLIGWLYVNGAQQFDSANAAKRALAVGEAKVHLAKTKGTLVTTAGRTCLTVNGIMKNVEKKKKLKQEEEKGKEKVT